MPQGPKSQAIQDQSAPCLQCKGGTGMVYTSSICPKLCTCSRNFTLHSNVMSCRSVNVYPHSNSSFSCVKVCLLFAKILRARTELNTETMQGKHGKLYRNKCKRITTPTHMHGCVRTAVFDLLLLDDLFTLAENLKSAKQIACRTRY